MKQPATQLTLVLEGSEGSETVQSVIRRMQNMSLAEIMQQPDIQEVYKPLYERHLRSIDIIKRVAHCERDVIFFDLVEEGLDGYNKFIPYYLFPDATYTVSVSVSTFRTKVSVGTSPWREEISHNIASICERYGGGGHARVGAISFPIGAVEPARRAADEIKQELMTP